MRPPLVRTASLVYKRAPRRQLGATTQRGRAMNAPALLVDTGSPPNPRYANLPRSSSCRAAVVAGLALGAMLPAASHVTAQEPESAAARIARENLPAVVTLIAVAEHDQPL